MLSLSRGGARWRRCWTRTSTRSRDDGTRLTRIPNPPAEGGAADEADAEAAAAKAVAASRNGRRTGAIFSILQDGGIFTLRSAAVAKPARLRRKLAAGAEDGAGQRRHLPQPHRTRHRGESRSRVRMEIDQTAERRQVFEEALARDEESFLRRRKCTA